MSKIIIYNKNDLPNSIDEIQIGSEINCILEDETRIYGKLLNNNLYNITMQQYGNKIDYKLIAKSFIKELRLYIADNKPLLELGDMVEITNVDGLNRISDCKKGTKNLIGLLGKIIMIDKASCSSIAYYLVDLPQIQNHYAYIDNKCIISGRSIFLAENLRLVKKENNKVDNTKFFNPSDIKPLNYKDLDGKTLKMTVVDKDECLLVAGIDKETNTIYMLHSEVK